MRVGDIIEYSDRSYVVDSYGSLRVNQYSPDSSGGKILERAARELTEPIVRKAEVSHAM